MAHKLLSAGTLPTVAKEECRRGTEKRFYLREILHRVVCCSERQKDGEGTLASVSHPCVNHISAMVDCTTC